MFFKPLTDQDQNFKLKSIYSDVISASGTWSDNGRSRDSPGQQGHWWGFKRSSTGTNNIYIGSSMSAQQRVLYYRVNRIWKKFVTQESMGVGRFVLVFDKDIFKDKVLTPTTGTATRFIESASTYYYQKSASALTQNQATATDFMIPIVQQGDLNSTVGYIFPYQGIFIGKSSSATMTGVTTVNFKALQFKQNAMYFCRAASKQFNFSNNSSFSAGNLQRCSATWITTVGLFGDPILDQSSINPGRSDAQRSPLLAVAKISAQNTLSDGSTKYGPAKKNDETQYIFKISLEF